MTGRPERNSSEGGCSRRTAGSHRRISHRRNSRILLRGQATLEVLVVLIILIPLIFGGIELSRGVAVRSALDSGVGVAVRALALDPSQWAWAGIEVQETVDRNILGSAGLSVAHLEAYNSSGGLINEGISSLSYGAPFYLEGWVVYTPQIPLVSLSTPFITIRVRHYGVIERI